MSVDKVEVLDTDRPLPDVQPIVMLTRTAADIRAITPTLPADLAAAHSRIGYSDATLEKAIDGFEPSNT